MSVIFYLMKFCSKFLPDFQGLDNVDLQNNYAIAWTYEMLRFKKLAARALSDRYRLAF